MIDRNGKTVVPFAPGSKGNVRVDGDPADEWGNAIVALLKGDAFHVGIKKLNYPEGTFSTGVLFGRPSLTNLKT